MASPAKRLFLIDGYSNIFRAFYAIRDLSNSKGEPTNAVYGFVNMLRKLLRDERPELVGVAWDAGDEVRRERFEAYKANRTPMPDDLRAQIPWIRQAIEAYRIPILEVERYEADDVLGTLARKAADAGYEVVLVSADKDLMQLVAPRVFVYHTGRERLYDPAAVEEDFGVPPERVADVLALKGDAVDNVPGVPGIGDKGARDLIRRFGSVEALLERASEVERKSYREGLEKHRDQALLSKELVTIHTDLPLELDLHALERSSPDERALRELFARLEFFSLLEELGPSAAVEAGAEPVAAAEATTPRAFREALARLPGQRRALSLVGPGGSGGLAVAGEEGGPLFADFRRPGLREAAAEALTAWMGEGGPALVGHDLKEVLRLSPEGPRCTAPLFDTLVVSHLVRAAPRGTSLDEVALERFQRKLISREEAGWRKGEEPPLGHAPLLALAGERAEVTRRLARQLESELGDGPLARIHREIEAPLIPVLLGMEEAGVRLDVPFLRSISERLAVELAGLETEIHQIAGEPFNLDSPRQLGVILFDKLGYPVMKKTRKTRSYSTDADVLQQLAVQGYPLAERLLRYRELAKLKSTYVDALPALVAADGRVHTRYNQVGAATGRISSNNPNLQNIPVRTEAGQQIRRAFVAGEGSVLLAADYSQIELRVLAHIAGEKTLLDAFRAGEDIHASTAALVFGGSAKLVTPEQRRAAKTINFGILYGMSAFGLAQNLGISTGEADGFIKAYLERLPAVKRYMDETLDTAQREGKVETLYGRARWLPEIRSKNWNLRENARRMAINARIQGTAADLLKKAMVAVARRLRRERPEARLLLTVHDELVLEAPEAEAPEVGELVRGEMAGVETLAVPLVVDVGWGRSWAQAK